MKSIKRIIPLVIVVVLLSSVFFGCQKPAPSADEKDASKAAASTASEQTKKEPVVLKAVLNVEPEIDLSNNPVLKKVEEATGIKLDIEAPPQNNYWDRTKVIVASGDLPDFMTQGTDVDFEKWSKEGILAVLDDKIKNYPNLVANISPQQWSDATALADGKIHAVPRPNSYDRWGYMINQKWLDNLGLQAPTTIEEFVNVCRAFTKNDPDKNGKNDTFGASFANSGENKLFGLRQDFISTAFNLSLHWGMPDVDGTFHTRATSSKYLDYLTLFRDMYKEGIIDKEFITYKNNENLERFAQNRVGIIGISDKDYFSDFFGKYSIPESDYANYTYHEPLKLDANGEAIYMMPPSNWCAYHIFADSKKIDDTLRFLDYANSEEGFKLFQFGIEGLTYTSYDINKRQLEVTADQLAAKKKVTGGWFEFANAFQGRPPVEGGTSPAQRAKWEKETLGSRAKVTEYYVPFVKQLYTLESDLPNETRTINNMEVRYVTGDISKEELQKYVTNDYAPKVKPYEDKYNEFMKANPVNKKKGGN